MKKILVIIGTRPEAIKMAPVVHVLNQHPKDFIVKVCLTGQHQEMLYQAIEYFDVPYDYDLKLMEKGQTLSSLTARLGEGLQPIFDHFKPDTTLVQGDTTSALMGALIAHYNKSHVGHVEAGLRTDNKFSPFPEEINRRLAGVLADYHFAPTKLAANALLKEGVNSKDIVVTGNTVIDALLYTLDKIRINPPDLGAIDKILKSQKRVVLITGHRRENFGKGFMNICNAIKNSAEQFPDVNFIYPVHLNPCVQKPVYGILQNISNIHLVEPMGYVPFVKLMYSAYIILTDSGGIQEEAPTLGKPVLVMRDVTERQEAVDAGAAILVGCSEEKITGHLNRLLTNEDAWQAMSNVQNPYGEGRAAVCIAEFLREVQ